YGAHPCSAPFPRVGVLRTATAGVGGPPAPRGAPPISAARPNASAMRLPSLTARRSPAMVRTAAVRTGWSGQGGWAAMETLMSPVVVDGLKFPEGPHWRDGKLWFSDMWSHQVMTVDPVGRTETVVAVPGRPSGLGFLPDGRLVIASMADRTLYRL